MCTFLLLTFLSTHPSNLLTNEQTYDAYQCEWNWITAIRWEEGTIDNEHLCRKSSKRKWALWYITYIPPSYSLILLSGPGCCIFHKRKAALESDSDESDSDIEEAEKADENPDPNKPKPYQMHHA